MPDDSFDYDDFTAREFGKKRVLPRGVSWWWWMVAIVLVALLIRFWIF